MIAASGINFDNSALINALLYKQNGEKISSILSHVPPNAGLSRYTRQTPSYSFKTKATVEPKKKKKKITKFWLRHAPNNCNISKELWFAGMGTDFIK